MPEKALLVHAQTDTDLAMRNFKNISPDPPVNNLIITRLDIC